MRIATDIGGTFTDLVLMDEDGAISVEKSDTTPPNYEAGVMDAIKKSNIDTKILKTFIHGTTVIINTLTERNGAKTGLITTKGFRDILEIARGNRPDLYNVNYQKPAPFVERHLRQEVDERLDYKGDVITPLDKNRIKEILSFFKEEKVEAIAISYLHAYVNPIHEKETVELISELWPEISVTASHEIIMEWREYERTNTAVLNSYVKPIAASYVDRLHEKLNETKTSNQKHIMQSNGGTTTFQQAKDTPINLVESGPAAGVYGAAVLGKMLGEENIIAFDVGGTTAKCSLVNEGEVKVTTDYYIERTEKFAGHPIKIPVVDIVEVGNGGGSIAWSDEAGSLKVGPKSAGAFPGPIAYGKGGTEPTTTDANILTGRLSSHNFDYKVDLERIEKAFKEKISEYYNVSVEEAALGVIRIANSNMLNALKLVSIRKGHNPQEFAIVAFGGGGPMHAAALAKELGVKKVIIPVAASVFSAWGMLVTDLRHDFVKTYITQLTEFDLSDINDEWINIEAQALTQYKKEAIIEKNVTFCRFVDMRYIGQEHTVKVPAPSGIWTDETVRNIIKQFHNLHEKNFTFKLEKANTEIVNLHLVAYGNVTKPSLKKINSNNNTKKTALKTTRQVYFEEGWLETNVISRESLVSGMEIEGPAIIEEKSVSTVLHPGQTLTVDNYNNLIIYTGV